MSRSARLVVRVVFVPGAGAADARRRVAEVLLRAATDAPVNSDAPAPGTLANEPTAPPAEKAA